MPKIDLLNNESGELEAFEPVDAREIMSNPNNDTYSIPEGASEQIGVALDPSDAGGVNIPQLQSGDAEMQTGNSVDKYARAAIVKAIPGSPGVSATADNPQTTTGKPLAKSKGKKAAAKTDETA